MTPESFIALWKNNPLTERAGAQAHFDDLCDLLGVDKPRDPDNYCFERGAKKSGGGDGWADVWKRGHFGWENKKPGRDLKAALKQLTDYALRLDNPPLLVVCDRERIIIHTAFTGYPDQPTEIRIDELVDPGTRQTLAWVFTDPERLRPSKSTAAITGEAAGKFAGLAEGMRARGQDGQQVAHFLVQCLFCMFAEDEELLPGSVFTGILGNAAGDAVRAAGRIHRLFVAMRDEGGEYGDHDIAWFNGGLFKTIDIPALTIADLAALHEAAHMDWRAIDPTIFGTLFERSLDPATRAPLGAHYTDTATIEKLITPLIFDPLLKEWQAVKVVIAAGAGKGQRSKACKDASVAWHGFLTRLDRFRVLDPACGSGNFLYLALAALREVERRVLLEGFELAGYQPGLWLHTGPHNICGIEINEYAAELARVTVWIGDLQWHRRNGREIVRNPILRSLDTIERRDALLGADGSEASWPAVDVIVGNPPFLGGSKKRGELGDAYFEALAQCYEGRVPSGADLVTYWFEKARAQIESGQAAAAGLVATNSIRGGANRKVLERIVASTQIFEAWSDEEWINNGAAVRVSLVCFGNPSTTPNPLLIKAGALSPPPESGGGRGVVAAHSGYLDGQAVAAIHADLTAGVGMDVTKALKLKENEGAIVRGIEKGGPFDIPGELTRQWLKQPNPNGRPNSEVVRPWANGMDITRRPSDTWLIDFGISRSEFDASLFESPFAHTFQHVKGVRAKNREGRTSGNWWLHRRSGEDLRSALSGLKRFICTPRVAKHRVFVWLDKSVLPDSATFAVARADDTTFGLLHSRFHELWSLATCTWLGMGNDPRYTPTTTFETFPFPAGLTPADTAPKSDEEKRAFGSIPLMGSIGDESNKPIAPFSSPTPAILADPTRRGHAQAIAAAAFRLNQLRGSWLNPPEWVEWVQTLEEKEAGFPPRPSAKPGHEADLKKRTLTNLYNLRPAWLDLAHRDLDATVAAAYGWADYTPDTSEATILGRLLELNQERVKG